MTGEITLRGNVLPIGGLKEKSISAHRSGIRKIIIPKENEKDIEDIPESVRNDLEIVFDLLAAILAAKEQGIGAILAFAMAYLRGRYNGGAFTKTVIDATMCAIIAWFIRDLLDFAGLSSNLAYITSVFIGYIGTDSIGSLIKRFAAKKAGVEDGGNQ